MASRMTGSARPKVSVRTRPRPRILARATSGPRASAASATMRKSSSQARISSCAVISTTGTSTARQLARTVPRVAGMDVVVVAPACCNCGLNTRSRMAEATTGTSVPVSWRGASQ